MEFELLTATISLMPVDEAASITWAEENKGNRTDAGRGWRR